MLFLLHSQLTLDRDWWREKEWEKEREEIESWREVFVIVNCVSVHHLRYLQWIRNDFLSVFERLIEDYYCFRIRYHYHWFSDSGNQWIWYSHCVLLLLFFLSIPLSSQSLIRFSILLLSLLFFFDLFIIILFSSIVQYSTNHLIYRIIIHLSTTELWFHWIQSILEFCSSWVSNMWWMWSGIGFVSSIWKTILISDFEYCWVERM